MRKMIIIESSGSDVGITCLFFFAAMGTAVVGAVWALKGTCVRSVCRSPPLTGWSTTALYHFLNTNPNQKKTQQ